MDCTCGVTNRRCSGTPIALNRGESCQTPKRVMLQNCFIGEFRMGLRPLIDVKIGLLLEAGLKRK
jgi:hypothetical protein